MPQEVGLQGPPASFQQERCARPEASSAAAKPPAVLGQVLCVGERASQEAPLGGKCPGEWGLCPGESVSAPPPSRRPGTFEKSADRIVFLPEAQSFVDGQGPGRDLWPEGTLNAEGLTLAKGLNGGQGSCPEGWQCLGPTPGPAAGLEGCALGSMAGGGCELRYGNQGGQTQTEGRWEHLGESFHLLGPEQTASASADGTRLPQHLVAQRPDSSLHQCPLPVSSLPPGA